MVKIIDASVALKWFVEEPGRQTALKILEKLIEDPSRFAVPELFYFELVNVVNRIIPRLSPNQKKILNTIFQIGMHRFSMTDELFEHITVFQKRGLSGYDASYIALARIIKGKWLTFDEKAYKKIAPCGLAELVEI